MREGDKIEARYRGGQRYFPGKIGFVNRDGTFDIDYDDGEKEGGVPADYVRSLGGGSGGGGGGGGSGFREGEKVEARYRGKARFYPGKIRRDRGDGSYDIDYDDGDKETGGCAHYHYYHYYCYCYYHYYHY